MENKPNNKLNRRKMLTGLFASLATLHSKTIPAKETASVRDKDLILKYLKHNDIIKEVFYVYPGDESLVVLRIKEHKIFNDTHLQNIRRAVLQANTIAKKYGYTLYYESNKVGAILTQAFDGKNDIIENYNWYRLKRAILGSALYAVVAHLLADKIVNKAHLLSRHRYIMGSELADEVFSDSYKSTLKQLIISGFVLGPIIVELLLEPDRKVVLILT